MPKIIFIQHDGKQREVTAEVGCSAMNAAANNMVPGILADCGGEGICGTCHGFVDEEWLHRLPPPVGVEKDMLEAGVVNPQQNSRLTCRIQLTDELDGLIIRLPKSQA